MIRSTTYAICWLLLVCLMPGVYEDVYAAHYVGRYTEPPVLSSPLTSQPAWTYGGGSRWELGRSVSAGDINGDGFSDVVIGAPYHNTYNTHGGKVFVFDGSSSGVSRDPIQEIAKVQLDAAVGFSVAVVGDIDADGFADVIIGAPLFNSPLVDAGRIFVYRGSASGLMLAGEWTRAGAQEGMQFGYSVAGAGDVNGDGYDDVIVSAPFADGDHNDEGRVFLYLGGSYGLQSPLAWSVDGDQAGSGFGMSIAGAGDVNRDGYSDVIIGAPLYDGAIRDEGAVFVYLGSPTGLDTIPVWTATGNLRDSWFGNSVSTAGDVDGDGYSDIIIGASEWYTHEANRDGRAYVYRGSPGGVEAESYWELTWSSREHFGLSVATAGDVNGDGLSDILVGVETVHTASQREFAFLFLGSASEISKTPDWRAIDYTYTDVQNAGIVASAGDVNGDGFSDVLIGDPLYDFVDPGRAVVYHAIPSPTLLKEESARSIVGTQADDRFGESIAGCGDVNGDGWADVIVGAPFFDGSDRDKGAAFLYTGSDNGLSPIAQWRGDGEVVWGWFGYAVSAAGDINGDGFDDVIVGAPRYANSEADEGAAYLFSGFVAGLSPSPAWIGEGNQVGAEYGFSVARAGDVNGDGFSDVIVGAFRYSNGEDEEGRAYVYYGSPGGLSDSLRWFAESDQAGAWFGYAVAGAGDINDDGFSDVIVGAPYFDNGETDEGRVFIYAGSSEGLPDAPTWTIEINREVSRLGISVAAAGDINRDGYGDIIIGAEGYLFELEDIGSVFVYLGSPTGPGITPAWSARGDPLTGALGKSITSAGDINGDGFSDIAIGDPLFDGSETDQGRVVVFTGSSRGLTAAPVYMFEGEQPEGWFGHAVASAGDINGDGSPDLIVGAPRLDVSGGRSGT